ncbi:GNAT family N-acetyltransferase [Roseibium salinum]|uniref:GNAT family N-acetyltransferase n=1 Tax=Roseibium salinum TaxID=1604349 RepID=A0ABT3QXT7_9HYPH|nr:GNAT family N-acetyltransferase [Roseibium sp. DSM 29163]MCX2721666.1 GNAT family N-acetyltransferase [Roseibium sp. DSM 29163]
MTSEPSSSLSTSFITARPCRPGDLSRLLQLNNAAVPAVNELTAEELLDLINSALICLVAEAGETAAGFLLCIGDGTGYESRNYRWLSERLSNFAYTDRIAVDETLRGQKIGDALYAALFRHFAGTQRCFVCEVNERPPNPGSVRFHKRLGFEEIGRSDHGDKAVVYMKRAPEPAGSAS